MKVAYYIIASFINYILIWVLACLTEANNGEFLGCILTTKFLIENPLMGIFGAVAIAWMGDGLYYLFFKD